ncbi:serine/threonine protein kinase [Aridibaculum aurantiacum]|uniref:serine/threonine protein kinase n=1 Tax=Aridibaculum aurantiacum TaxID=2810307 RepID=UPI001A9715D2|nr:serine/threonine-protein kinase [Aridibaculum aurantiacum]
MSKVFTITDGLENLGAMKTGGQGSVYKGKRTGEIITAIKLLPTPIFNPTDDDRSYRDFKNEVDKLKRVNEEPHPNVVTILSSGVSDTGNFPFIEMEYIEGPDLEELLKPPHDPLFCIKDVCKVAEHLSNALAHCHKYGVKHGDIKSNNVKFNINTGNFVLLDFGLSVMSDEQRRTSLRNAGAIEFMAPEQNDGEILFATDVYSFGVIIFELLTGRVPFPLNDRTESARNTVRLSHIETPAPDLVELRTQNIPAEWPEAKKERELHIPEWLVTMVYKCLEKNPKERFEDGVLLHDFIVHERHASKTDEVLASQLVVMKKVNKQLTDEVSSLKQTVARYEKQLAAREHSHSDAAIIAPARASEATSYSYEGNSSRSVSRSTFMVVLVLAIAFAVIAAYSFFSKGNADTVAASYAVGNDSLDSVQGGAPLFSEQTDDVENKPVEQLTEADAVQVTERKPEETNVTVVDTSQAPVADTSKKVEKPEEQTAKDQQDKPAGPGTRYRVAAKAYFHSKADESSRTNEFIIPGNVIVRAIEDKGEFILVNFKDDQGETTTGWIRKKDLARAN